MGLLEDVPVPTQGHMGLLALLSREVSSLDSVELRTVQAERRTGSEGGHVLSL